VKTEAARLRVEQRQIVEIARALFARRPFHHPRRTDRRPRRPRVEQLFEACVGEARRRSLLYISHHLHEIYELCDSVTVMRDGQVVAEAPLADMPKPAVVAAMVGDEARTNAARAPPSNPTRPILPSKSKRFP